MVMVVSMFPLAPLFLFLGSALTLGSFSGQRFLEVVEAIHHCGVLISRSSQQFTGKQLEPGRACDVSAVVGTCIETLN
jgi:hypothetical protein